ncbi:MAG: HetP family heterocyst commitment protein [Cyanobacteria bacterium P01_F01_bin.53]
MFSNRFQESTKVINDEQLDVIIEAILQGKYSNACLLLLEAIGHNPLHYIPYRTYNRLQKQRQKQMAEASTSVTPLSEKRVSGKKIERGEKVESKQKGQKSFADLDYVELLSNQSKPVKGGNLITGFFPTSRRSLEEYVPKGYLSQEDLLTRYCPKGWTAKNWIVTDYN